MLGTLVAENDVPFPAFSCVVIFTACAWVLARQLEKNFVSTDFTARVVAFGMSSPLKSLNTRSPLFTIVHPWRLDLYLSRRILAVAGFLLVLPPAIVTLCLEHP